VRGVKRRVEGREGSDVQEVLLIILLCVVVAVTSLQPLRPHLLSLVVLSVGNCVKVDDAEIAVILILHWDPLT